MGVGRTMKRVSLEIGDPLRVWAQGKVGLTGYRGSVNVQVHEQPGMRMESYWAGGTRSEFTVVDTRSDGTWVAPENGSGFTPREDIVAEAVGKELPRPGMVVLETGWFCGKDRGLTIHIHKDDVVVGLLPAAEVLTPDERDVLGVVAGLKAHARVEELARKMEPGGQWNPKVLRRAQELMQATIPVLASKGLVTVNARGAVSVTVKGRNSR